MNWGMVWQPDYATTAQLAAYLRIGDTLDDPQLTVAVSTASRAIDRATNRQFGQLDAPATWFYTACWSPVRRQWVISIDDLMTTAGLTVAADLDDDGVPETPITAFALRPHNAAQQGRPWTQVLVHRRSTVQPTGRDGAVAVTGRFGWSAVPGPVHLAALLQASRVHARREAPFGVAGSPDAGSEMRLLAKVDPDVAVAVQPYRKVFTG